MARKKKQAEGGAGLPLWMATYGDMVTLLLCFFVLLYSFSTLDAEKFKAITQSIQSALNVMPGGQTPSPTPIEGGSIHSNVGDSKRPTEGQDQHIARQMRTVVKELGIEDQANISENERGVRVSLTDQVLFDNGSAVLRPEAARILYKIGEALREIPNQIAVEGHTDNTPLGRNSIYQSNWGLSAARAASVAAYFESQIAIPAGRMQAVGYSSSMPNVPNDTEYHRRLNRRMDLMILSRYSVN